MLRLRPDGGERAGTDGDGHRALSPQRACPGHWWNPAARSVPGGVTRAGRGQARDSPPATRRWTTPYGELPYLPVGQRQPPRKRKRPYRGRQSRQGKARRNRATGVVGEIPLGARDFFNETGRRAVVRRPAAPGPAAAGKRGGARRAWHEGREAWVTPRTQRGGHNETE